MKKKKKEITPNQGTFSGKTIETEEEIKRIESEIEEIEDELEDISHIRSGDICLANCCIDVLRYGGERTYWFFNSPECMEEGECKECEYHDKCVFVGAPSTLGYDFGYYPNEKHEEAEFFVLDRCDWAEKWLNNEKEKLLKEIEELEEVNIYANRKI